jgi:putative hydrolase of the HAD superfamily
MMETLPPPAEYLPRLLTEHKRAFLDRIRQRSAPIEPLPTETEAQERELDGVRAVVFDIYGTLLAASRGEVGSDAETSRSPTDFDPEEYIDSADEGPATHALTQAGYHPPAGCGPRALQLYREAIAESHAEDRALGVAHPEVDILAVWEVVLRRLASEGLIEEALSPWRLVTTALEFELRTNKVWPMPGAREALAALQQEGALLGIVSNAQFYTPLMLEALFEAPLEELGFSAQIWSYREREAKPSPRLFRTLFERFSERGVELRPQECVYVGNDMLNDIHTAGSVGLRTILFAGDGRSLRLRRRNPAVLRREPDAVCTALQRLANIVTITSG